LTYQHGHLTVVERRPPLPQREVVGHIYNIVPEAEPESRFPRINIEPEDLEEDEVETKVVKARRGRRPVIASEVAEVE